MAIDVSRIVQAALEAATQGQSSDEDTKRRKPRLSGGRALMIGAGLVTVGRLAVPKGRDLLESLQQRLEDEPEPDDELQETEEEYDEEPEDGGDEDFDDEEDDGEEEEYDEEPEGEVDEGVDEEEGEDNNEPPRRGRRTRSRARSR